MDINKIHQEQKDFWKDECMKLREENKKLKEEVKQEKSKNSDLLSFIGGNFDYEDKVKEQIKEFYTEEFIKSNEEQWSQVCIDWDDSDFQ